MQFRHWYIDLVALEPIHACLQDLTILDECPPTFGVRHYMVILMAQSTVTSPQRVQDRVTNRIEPPSCWVSARYHS